MVFLVITYIIKNEFRNSFIEAANKYIDASRKETINLSFDYGQGKNENDFVFVSRWVSDKSYNEHKKTEHFKEFANSIIPMLGDNFIPNIIKGIR
ncbi:putative quinol monooxygenase [Mycoplasma elephantis]|uniref:putative quinol monooxygenase n=1 Tax=Mycoplasma elephantis TaxID=114882 RepID=UPI0006908219|nr:antibiotic biosynthesis monooxygenase [Mycoplasma elephantis]